MFCVICKKYKYPIFLMRKNFYCTNHTKLLYASQIVTIQKIYRGYKVRRTLKRIYFKLPRDLQVHILSFNCGKTTVTKKNDYLQIQDIIKTSTVKITDFYNLSSNKITLTEINNILLTLIIYKKYIDYKWFNYYKYYFNNIYSVLLILSEIHDLPNTFAYLVSVINNDIYESLDLNTNFLNNDFKSQVKVILNNITLFLNDSKCSIK
jgi:hypothetical protein